MPDTKPRPSIAYIKKRLSWTPFSQADLARAMGWHPSYLSLIFSGRRNVTGEQVDALIVALEKLVDSEKGK